MRGRLGAPSRLAEASRAALEKSLGLRLRLLETTLISGFLAACSLQAGEASARMGAKKGCIGKDTAFLLAVGSFLLTVELFYLQLTILAFLLTILAILLTVGAFSAHNGKVRIIRDLRDRKQRSLTVSKEAPIVSKKAYPNK